MSLDKALATAQADVPECVATGYVDMESGLLLGVKTVDSHPSEVLDLVAAATGDLFQGKNVVEIEKLFDKARGITTRDANNHYFKEIVVFSTNLIHVFIRSKKHPGQAAVFVCRASANIGMVIVRSRSAMNAIESAM
ncbi:hypothetical protein CO615_03100 [Lysobacteraceae bacterium NML75-0749]|nr:hypothetical protein CO611_05115 [Xanthomonadaceae bacterium NML03-0222]PJK02180.1 hypothetical protein CO615_03100 [Xanthomonadaceae bacterium NML75-0749]PJK02628.1 hypothetical protein CO609_09115 [Xanthomonadaceae bacterium NML91-0268]PJK03054.1 hypothetical protein CO612_09410 [Xanthomonadaceae bacterium NML71-0210]PJK15151.1 hypothetical protein CO613_01965 [Xanthomonadaceae bacterium NML07-0707]